MTGTAYPQRYERAVRAACEVLHEAGYEDAANGMWTSLLPEAKQDGSALIAAERQRQVATKDRAEKLSAAYTEREEWLIGLLWDVTKDSTVPLWAAVADDLKARFRASVLVADKDNATAVLQSVNHATAKNKSPAIIRRSQSPSGDV